MPAGADKLVLIDPPGTIGLIDREAVLLLRLDEELDQVRPQDATGVLQDLDTLLGGGTLTMPPVVPGALGRARAFDPDDSTGLAARDIDSGATLLTRDMSIQVALRWDVAAQDASGSSGSVISRGLGSSAAEYLCWGMQLDVVDAPSRTGRVRWIWQDLAGVVKLQSGAQFVAPLGFTILTITRRWRAPDDVRLRYYIGDVLLGEVLSVDGSIGGGTTGAVQLGTRLVGGVDSLFFAGDIDQVLIVERELCLEEIEATWLRITLYQPLGYQLLRENHDRGFPMPTNPASDFQLDLRMIGHTLGYTAAKAEELRANFLPGRAYGSTLEQWEEVLQPVLRPGADIETRRARCEARLRQRRGATVDGIGDALFDLVDCDVADLEFIAYSQRVEDGFDMTIDTIQWDMTPTGCASWNAGAARFAPGAGTFLMNGTTKNWKTMARSVSQPSIPGVFGAEHVIGKLAVSTPQNNFEAGVWFGNKGAGDYLLLGLRQDGTFRVVTESFIANVSQGVTVQQALGGNPAAIWLHLYELTEGSWRAAWSTTSALAGYTTSTAIAHPSVAHWAGFYIRSIAAVGAGPVADFDDFLLYTPNGTRPFNAYVYRNPVLGGEPDFDGAHSVLTAIKHAFTHATIIDSKAFLAGVSGCNRGPMGSP